MKTEVWVLEEPGYEPRQLGVFTSKARAEDAWMAIVKAKPPGTYYWDGRPAITRHYLDVAPYYNGKYTIGSAVWAEEEGPEDE